MNKTAVRYVAQAMRNDALAGRGVYYHQGYFGTAVVDCPQYLRTTLPHPCKTAACIAGYAGSLLNHDGSPKDVPSIPDLASGGDANGILKLTEKQAEKLFLLNSLMGSNGHVTRDQAADVLEHFADTGRITWNKFVPGGVALC